MAKDHFIPAALLGRFSEDESGPLRQRRLHVVSRHTPGRVTTAASIGYKKRLYDVDQDFFQTSQGRAIDKLWDAYEPQLPRVLDDLIAGTLSASDWIRILVPFVAATFARDRSYEARIVARLKEDGVEDPQTEAPDLFDKTHLNLNRLVEMNRFAARAIVCEWCVFELDGDIVIPDLGFGFDLLSDPDEEPERVGFMLPVGRRHILELMPVTERVLATRSVDGTWQVPLVHARSAGSSVDLNRYLCQCAQDFVAGTEAAIESISAADLSTFGPSQIEKVLGQWPFNIDTLVLAGLHAPVDKLLHDEPLDLDEWLLDRFEGVTELDSRIDFRFARTARRLPVSCFLATDGSTIRVRAHSNDQRR